MDMKISAACPTSYGKEKYFTKTREVSHSQTYAYHNNSFAMFDKNQAMLNKLLLNKISFKGYYGDPQPLKKLFWISTNRNDVYEDNWTKEHIYKEIFLCAYFATSFRVSFSTTTFLAVSADWK